MCTLHPDSIELRCRLRGQLCALWQHDAVPIRPIAACLRPGCIPLWSHRHTGRVWTGEMRASRVRLPCLLPIQSHSHGWPPPLSPPRSRASQRLEQRQPLPLELLRPPLALPLPLRLALLPLPPHLGPPALEQPSRRLALGPARLVPLAHRPPARRPLEPQRQHLEQLPRLHLARHPPPLEAASARRLNQHLAPLPPPHPSLVSPPSRHLVQRRALAALLRLAPQQQPSAALVARPGARLRRLTPLAPAPRAPSTTTPSRPCQSTLQSRLRSCAGRTIRCVSPLDRPLTCAEGAGRCLAVCMGNGCIRANVCST